MIIGAVQKTLLLNQNWHILAQFDAFLGHNRKEAWPTAAVKLTYLYHHHFHLNVCHAFLNSGAFFMALKMSRILSREED